MPMCLNITQSWVLCTLEKNISDLKKQQEALTVLKQPGIRFIEVLKQLKVLDDTDPRHRDMLAHLQRDWIGVNYWPHSQNKEFIILKGLKRTLERANGRPISIRWMCVGRETDLEEIRFEFLIDDLGERIHAIILTPRTQYSAPPPDGVPSTEEESIESICDVARKDQILIDTHLSHPDSLPKMNNCDDLGDDVWKVPVYTAVKP